MLSDVERVRLRPATFGVDNGTRGMHRLLWEVVGSAVDEANFGHNDAIDVTINADNSVTVADCGRGIPVDVIADYGLPALTVVLTRLHRNAFNTEVDGHELAENTHFYVAVVNALSAWLTVEVRRNGRIHCQDFTRGEPTSPVTATGFSGSDTGTKVMFMPDSEIFGTTTWSRDSIREHLRTTASVTPGLEIRLNDDRDDHWSEDYRNGDSTRPLGRR